MDVKSNLEEILKEIPENVKLVVVSKTMPVLSILEAYNTGHRVFGENKAQELVNKQPSLPDDISWHFIGHLQRNKVKQIVPFVAMVESVDSERLLKEIDKEGAKVKRVVDCLLQFHIATEDSKFGFNSKEATDMLSSKEFRTLSHVRICGVMGMATWTEDATLIRKEFRSLSAIYEELKEKFFRDSGFFKEISMGMSGDYKIAIEEGSTIIRIGSAIFGERNYSA